MKKIIIFLLMSVFLCHAAHGSQLDVKILSPEEIAKLSDKNLVDTYIDVSVEIEAAKSFYATSGFVPEDYQRFKEVLKYRVQLIQEMGKRKIAVPRVE